MKVAIYCRVSTVEQTIDSQLRDLKAFVAQKDYEIFKIYTDIGISGSIKKRPELDLLMDDARKGKFDSVIVWRFDRFARSTQHLTSALIEFKSLKIGFMSYSENIDTTSPIGEAIFTIIAAMAQLERDIIRERVRAGLRAAKEKGVKLGRPLVKQDKYAQIIALRDQGLSVRKIAKQLKMAHRTIYRILQNAETELSKTSAS